MSENFNSPIEIHFCGARPDLNDIELPPLTDKHYPAAYDWGTQFLGDSSKVEQRYKGLTNLGIAILLKSDLLQREKELRNALDARTTPKEQKPQGYVGLCPHCNVQLGFGHIPDECPRRIKKEIPQQSLHGEDGPYDSGLCQLCGHWKSAHSDGDGGCTERDGAAGCLCSKFRPTQFRRVQKELTPKRVSTGPDQFTDEDFVFANAELERAAISENNARIWLMSLSRCQRQLREAKKRDASALQETISAWVIDRFGIVCQTDYGERAMRVLEEAYELAQSVGVSSTAAFVTLQHVYSKPKGNPAQELAGVGVTALAMAECLGEDFATIVIEETTRILGLSREHFQKRHQAKADAGIALPPQTATEAARG
jgi:hypothetical protein